MNTEKGSKEQLVNLLRYCLAAFMGWNLVAILRDGRIDWNGGLAYVVGAAIAMAILSLRARKN